MFQYERHRNGKLLKDTRPSIIFGGAVAFKEQLDCKMIENEELEVTLYNL